MTPKQKAAQLFNKYCYAIRVEEDNSGYFTNIFYAKQCALIAVDEILQSHYALLTGIKSSTYNYWQEVKEEIEKL